MAVSVGATYSESLHDLVIYECVPHSQQYGHTVCAQQTLRERWSELGAALGVPCLACVGGVLFTRLSCLRLENASQLEVGK